MLHARCSVPALEKDLGPAWTFTYWESKMCDPEIAVDFSPSKLKFLVFLWSLNRSAGSVCHNSCLVLARRRVCRSQVCFFGATLGDGSGPKVATAEGWPIGATEESLWVACRAFWLRRAVSFSYSDSMITTTMGQWAESRSNVHSGFLSILTWMIVGWHSKLLPRYYARAALLQVHARRVTAKDFARETLCRGDGKWRRSVGIADSRKIGCFQFQFSHSLEIWCPVDCYFLHIWCSTLLLHLQERLDAAGAFPALARGLCSPTRLHGSARQLSWWDGTCHGRNSWCGG